MKGYIHLRKDRDFYVVCWYDKRARKKHRFSHYMGNRLYRTSLEPKKDQGLANARKLLALMQADEERGAWNLEKYRSEPTDTIPFLWDWFNNVISRSQRKPATVKDYYYSIRNHLEPFFKKNPFNLHEIELDILTRLMQSIGRSGKGKQNVMFCLHTALDYAVRCKKIPVIPPFPKREEYGIIKPAIRALSSERQAAVIDRIPEVHRAIFWWLAMHYRRPGEAQALHKDDLLDGLVFHVHRTFSNRRLTEATKTGYEHRIPMVDAFRPWHEKNLWHQKKWGIISPFYFVNPTGKKFGKHYVNKFLNDLWNAACRDAGENIPLYPGTKHSSCTIFLNEKGGTFDELQIITDHARRDSVMRYGDMKIARRKELMERIGARSGPVLQEPAHKKIR